MTLIEKFLSDLESGGHPDHISNLREMLSAFQPDDARGRRRVFLDRAAAVRYLQEAERLADVGGIMRNYTQLSRWIDPAVISTSIQNARINHEMKL